MWNVRVQIFCITWFIIAPPLRYFRFRWAKCQIDALENCLCYPELQQALASLPKTLDETYNRILARIPEGQKQTAIRILQFLASSERPLRIEEVVEAIAVNPEGKPQFDSKNRMPEPSEISRYCSGLVVVVPRTDYPIDQHNWKMVKVLQLAHFSVKEYLTSGRVEESFQGSFTEINARGSITRVCLAYLSQPDEKDPPTEIEAAFPLAQYSAQYWLDHARPAEPRKDVQESILKFFLQQRNAYKVWGGLFDPDRPWSGDPWSEYLWIDAPRGYRNMATPLYYASLAGLGRTVESLLEKGQDINASGGLYGNALQAASSRGHEKVVQMLLERGADVNAQGGRYGNALQAASSRGDEKVVQILLKESADVNTQGGYYGNALQAASLRGHEKVVQILLKEGADVNTQGGYYGNALQAASLRGHEKVVQILLKEGTDVNTQGGYYGNALQASSLGGHEKVVQILLKEGADVNAQGGRCGNALRLLLQEATRRWCRCC